MSISIKKNNKLIFLTMAFAVLLLFFSLSGMIRGVFSADGDKKTYTYRDVNGNSEELTEEQYNAQIAQETHDAFKASNSGVLNSATENSSNIVTAATNSVGSAIVSAMVNSFSPTFTAWHEIESGQPAGNTDKEVLDVLSMSESDFALEMPQAYRIFKVSKFIGVFMGSIFLIVNMIICLFGQSAAIRTNPVKIFVMYCVSMFTIVLAYKMIVIFTDVMNNVWTLVMSYKDVALGWHHMYGAKALAMTVFLGGPIGAIVAACLSNPLVALIIAIVTLIIIWKFMKGLFRIYCQIIEYYLIYIILLLLFPAVAPTIITPSTSNIFKSYIRMVATQTLLLIFTSIMMKTYVALLIQGAFFVGIPNIIAGLAFIKITQNLQQYASAMGLNSVQATGNFTSAVGRGFGAFALGTLGAMRMASFGGQTFKNAGIAMNNERLFNLGSALSNPIQTVMQNSTKNGRLDYATNNHQSFTEAILNKNNANGYIDGNGFESLNKSTLSGVYDNVLRNHFGEAMKSDGTITSGKVTSIRQYENGNVLIQGKDINGNKTNVLADKYGQELGSNLILEQTYDDANINQDILGSEFMMGGNGFGQNMNNPIDTPIIGSDIKDPSACVEITGGMIGQFTIDNPNAMFACEKILGTDTAEGYQARYSYTIPEGSMDKATYSRLTELGFKDKGTKVTEKDGKSYLTHIFDRTSFIKNDIHVKGTP